MSAKNLCALRWPSILPNFAIGSTFVFAHPMCLLVFQSFSGVLQSTQTHVSTNGYLNINLPASCENNACGENMTIVVNLSHASEWKFHASGRFQLKGNVFLDTYTGAVGTTASGNLPASIGLSSSVSWARPRPPPPPTTNDRPQHRTFHPSRGPPHRGDRERRRLMGGTHVAIDTTLVSPLTRSRRATTQTCRMICRGSVAGR